VALPPRPRRQLGALGLIVLYNTIYTQRALDHITATIGTGM
jgi:hypothetical protein